MTGRVAVRLPVVPLIAVVVVLRSHQWPDPLAMIGGGGDELGRRWGGCTSWCLVAAVVAGVRSYRDGVALSLLSHCLSPITPSPSTPPAVGRQPCLAVAHGSGGAPILVLPVVHELLVYMANTKIIATHIDFDKS
ncbi:hypothetical protein ACLOJK_030343 [Asimina triloba]